MLLLLASRAKHLRSRLDRALMSEAQYSRVSMMIGIHGLVDPERHQRRQAAKFSFTQAMKRVRLLLGNIDALSNLLDRTPPPPDAEVSSWRLVLSIMLQRSYAAMACLHDPSVIRRLGQSVPALCQRSETADPAIVFPRSNAGDSATGTGIVPLSAVLVWLRHAHIQSKSSNAGSKVWNRENVVRQAKHIMESQLRDSGSDLRATLHGFGHDPCCSFVPFSVFRHIIVRLISDEYVNDFGQKERFLFHGRGAVPQEMKCLIVSLPCPPVAMVLNARAALLALLSDVQHDTEKHGTKIYPKDGQADEALLKTTARAEEELFRLQPDRAKYPAGDGEPDDAGSHDPGDTMDWDDSEDTKARRERRRFLQRTIKARRASQ